MFLLKLLKKNTFLNAPEKFEQEKTIVFFGLQSQKNKQLHANKEKDYTTV